MTKSKGNSLVLILLVILILIGLGAGAFYYQSLKNQGLSGSNPASPSPTPVAAWKTYTNEYTNFSIDYPPEWTVSRPPTVGGPLPAGEYDKDDFEYKSGKTTYLPMIIHGSSSEPDPISLSPGDKKTEIVINGYQATKIERVLTPTEFWSGTVTFYLIKSPDGKRFAEISEYINFYKKEAGPYPDQVIFDRINASFKFF